MGERQAGEIQKNAGLIIIDLPYKINNFQPASLYLSVSKVRGPFQSPLRVSVSSRMFFKEVSLPGLGREWCVEFLHLLWIFSTPGFLGTPEGGSQLLHRQNDSKGSFFWNGYFNKNGNCGRNRILKKMAEPEVQSVQPAGIRSSCRKDRRAWC